VISLMLLRQVITIVKIVLEKRALPKNVPLDMLTSGQKM
jgi:hypothetical protein